MKIERPKCEEYVLFLASQSYTQRVVVKVLSECTEAKRLESALANVTLWPWDRGDLLCWASVLNIFDDFLLVYVVNKHLGGVSALKVFRDLLQQGVAVSGIPSDHLILSILNVTYFILFNSSSRWVYNSISLLIALLDSFNPSIVCGAFQCLCLMYSSLRNKRRPAESIILNEILLRLPFFCGDPLADLEEKTKEKPSTYLAPTQENAPSAESLETPLGVSKDYLVASWPVSDGKDEGTSSAPPSHSASDHYSSQEQQDRPLDSCTFLNDENIGEFLRLYNGQFHVDPHWLASRHVSLSGGPPNDELNTKERRIPYTELLNGFTPAAIGLMPLHDISEHQSQIFQKIAPSYFADSTGDATHTENQNEMREMDEAQYQEIRQKLRHVWWALHPEGRQRLVDIRLNAFSTMIAVNPQFFLNYLGTFSTMLTDLTCLLRFHYKLHARTLFFVLDLWTAIIQDDLQRRAVTFLLGLTSPHGLFPTLVLKFLRSAIVANKQRIPVCLTCSENGSSSTDLLDTPMSHEPTKTKQDHEEPQCESSSTPASSFPSHPNLNGNGSAAHQDPCQAGGYVSCEPQVASSPIPPSIVVIDPQRLLEAETGSALHHHRLCSGLPQESHFDLFLDPGGSKEEYVRLLCQVLEHLMELILSVKMTSMFPLTALSHTTLLKCLVEFIHVLNPVFLPLMIRTSRIFESLVDVTPVVDGVLDILVNATHTLQFRLQYEVLKLSTLPLFDADITRIVEGPSMEFRHLVDVSCKDPRYRHLTVEKVEATLQNLSSCEALEVLQLIQEVTHRRSLVYFIFRQLDACIHGSNPGFTRRIVDLYSGPCCLASRFVFQHPFDFGLGVYGVAATLLGDYLAEDPSVQPTLIRRGLIYDFVHSISEHILPSEDALQAISLCLSSILLHNSGCAELQRLNYSPIYTLISVVTREEVVGFDRVGELMTIMGNRLADAAKHQEKAEHHIVEATLRMVKSFTQVAYQLPPWSQVSSSDTERILNDYLTTSPASVDVLRLPPMPSCHYLSDRLANMARFLQALLRSFKMILLFINRKGPEDVLHAALAPSLPPLFLRVLPHHPLNGLLRMLVTSGADLSLPNATGHSYPVFVRQIVETLPKLVRQVASLPNLSPQPLHPQGLETPPPVTPDVENFLKSISQLDLALHLLLDTNKDAASYSMTLSSLWSRGHHLPFIRLACFAFAHLYTLFPNLLRFIYRHTQIHSTDTPSILASRHCCHEHPGVRASRKYLPPDAQPLQATKFFWSSLARFAYSVPNPCFVGSPPHQDPSLGLHGSSKCTPALVLEVVRTTCIQCRLIISLASRFINKVTTGRVRINQHTMICVDRLATASYVALTARELLKDIPVIPLPRTADHSSMAHGLGSPQDISGARSDAAWGAQTSSDAPMIHEPAMRQRLHAPGLTPFQTARYISETMDILFRLHVNERFEGCLFTLTLDTFYKIGGISLVLNSFHYCFGLLVAMSAHAVCQTKKQPVEVVLRALENLLSVQNAAFVVWIRLMVQELDQLPQSLFKTACDVVFKCLHCCISYCEKITSWKRLHNSLMTDYLQKTSKGAPSSTMSGRRLSPSKEPTCRSANVPRMEPSVGTHDSSPSSCSGKVSVGVGVAPVRLSGLFQTCLPPCGSGGEIEFDADTLLRSIQGEAMRNLLAWIEGLFGKRPEQETDLCYHFLYETLMSHFSIKAVNCMIKICFHFFDAEASLKKKKHNVSSQDDACRTAHQERRPQESHANAANASLCDTLDQLVERQLSCSSRDLELSENKKPLLGFSPTSSGHASQSVAHDAACCVKVDAGVQTESHMTLQLSYLGFMQCQHAVDWTANASTCLLNYIQTRVIDVLLDLGRCMLNYPDVICETLLRLMAIPLRFGPPERGSGLSSVQLDPSNLSRQVHEQTKITSANGRYVARCLIHRLESLYEFLGSMDEETKQAFYHLPWHSAQEDQGRSRDSKKRFFGVDGPERESTGKPLKGEGREKLSPSVITFQARRVHEILHNNLYIFANLLHRSSVVRQAFVSHVPKALEFFHKFVSLMVVARKSVYGLDTFPLVNFKEFSHPLHEQLGVDVSNPSPFLSSVRVPTWCTKPCRPYLLVNPLAEKAVNSFLLSEFKKDPVHFNLSEKSQLALDQAEPEFPHGSQPPEWFTYCFLGMEMSLLFYELDHSHAMDFFSFVYGQKSSRLVPVEKQASLINTCLDVLYYFPGLGGSLTTVILNLLIHLTSIASNATHLLHYKPAPSIDLPGGGLSVLLSLPRTTHFTGILRLMSALLFNLCENKLTLEMRLKKELAQYISTQGTVKKFTEQWVPPDLPDTVQSPGRASSTPPSPSLDQETKLTQHNTSDTVDVEHRVVPLDAVLVNLYIYLRRDPSLFKRVLIQDCIFYVQVSGDGLAKDSRLTPATPPRDEAHKTDRTESSAPDAPRSLASRPKSSQIYLAYHPCESSGIDEHRLAEEIKSRGSLVISTVLNYLALFITIQAHSRLTPSFADSLCPASDRTKSSSSSFKSDARDFLMFPYALLPDSLLFLLDELLSMTPQYVSFFIERSLGPSPLQHPSSSRLLWPDENVSWGSLLTKPWTILEAPMCPSHWNLIAWLIRYIFPKLITLSSPASCSTAEWKEGERLNSFFLKHMSNVDDLNALSASTLKGGSPRTLDILLHFSTRLLKRLCLLDTRIAQQCLLEFTHVLLELEKRSARRLEPNLLDKLSSKVVYGAQEGELGPGGPNRSTQDHTALAHLLWSLGICSAASTLCGIFQLCVNSGQILNARQIMKNLKQTSSVPTLFVKGSGSGSNPDMSSGDPCTPRLTVKDILCLRHCVLRLLALVDLSSCDAQPLCRSLIRLLECLVRDPVLLLLLFGVSDSLLSLELNNWAERQHQDVLDTSPPCPVTESLQAEPDNRTLADRSVFDPVNYASQHLNTTYHPYIASSITAGDFPLSLSGRSVEEDGEDLSQDNANEGLEDSADEDDNSSDENDDIVMEEQDEAVSLSLPHEAEEHEDSEAYFGVPLPRLAVTDSDSEGDEFEEDEDIPRIRDDDEDAEIMLLMPDDLSRSQLINMHDNQVNRSVQLLAVGDDDDDEDDGSGTPGLLNSEERMCGEQFDEDMSNSNITLADDSEDEDSDEDNETIHNSVSHLPDDEEDEPPGDPDNVPRDSHGEQALRPASDPSEHQRHVSTSNASALEIVLRNSSPNDLMTSLPGFAEMLSHDGSESLVSNVQPFSLEVLYACQAQRHVENSFQGNQRQLPNAQQTYGAEPATRHATQDERGVMDDQEADSSIELTLPDLAATSLTNVARLGTLRGGDNVQFNVGFDMVVPSRLGHSPIASLYLSFPTSLANGAHRSISGNTSLPTETTGQQSVGWTSPGDLALPVDSAALLSPYVTRQNTAVHGTSFGITSLQNGLSPTEHNVNLPYSFQTSLRPTSRLTDPPPPPHSPSGSPPEAPTYAQDDVLHWNIPPLFSLGHILFDPWSQAVVAFLHSGSGETTNTYTSAARTAWLRSRLWSSRNPDEYRGLDVVLTDFRHWFEQEKSIDRRLCRPSLVRPKEDVLGEASGDHAFPAPSHNASDPSFHESPDNLASPPQCAGPPPHPTTERLSSAQDDTDSTHQEPLRAPSSPSADQDAAQPILLDDVYHLWTDEEASSPLGFSSPLVSHVALLLGLTPRQLLSLLGIDTSFIAEIPEDIQMDIFSQQLPSMSLANFLAYRRENTARVQQLHSEGVHPNRLTPSAGLASSTSSRPIEPASAQLHGTPPVHVALERNDTSENHLAPDPHPPETPEAMPNPSSSDTAASCTRAPAPPRVEIASLCIDQSLLSALPSEVLPYLTIPLSENALPHANSPSYGPQSTTHAAGVDNARFLATLDTALREDLLLTVADEELNALPAQYVAEAALLRDRARRPVSQDTTTTARSSRNVPTSLLRPIQAAQVTWEEQFPFLARVYQNRRGSENHRHAPSTTQNTHLHQLYNALFNAMQLTFLRNTSLALQSSAQTNHTSGPPSNDASAPPTEQREAFQHVMEDVGVALGPNALSLSGMYNGSSLTSRRLISDALDQILGDVDSSRPSTFRATARLNPRRLAASNNSSRNAVAGEAHLVTNGLSLSHPHESQSSSLKNSANRFAFLRQAQDVLSYVRYSSSLDLPIDTISILIICRLLFLKKQIYRRDMHRLFFSLAASHQCTRNQLLQFLMVVLWNAVSDLQGAFNLPRASPKLLELGFPPERLYFSFKHSASLLFDGHPETASSIAGYRALEHIRSLLEVIPSVSEFFALYTLHPAYVGLDGLGLPATTSHEHERGLKDQVHSPPPLSSQPPSFHEHPTASRWYPPTHTNDAKEPNFTRESADFESHKRLKGTEAKHIYEFPINILLILTSSKLFHTSSSHMTHLLSAINFLLCGPQHTATVTNVLPSTPQHHTSETTTTADANPQTTRPTVQDDAPMAPSLTHTQHMASQDASSITPLPSFCKQILNVVSLDAALTLCRLFTGTPLTGGEMNYRPTFLNMYYSSANTQASLPILSRIVSLLYWSPKHHDPIHHLLVSSLASLVQYISRYLEALKTHVLSNAQLYSPGRNEKNLDTPYDFLAPENIRTPLDISLNLLLRITLSLQDVFWNNPAASSTEHLSPQSSQGKTNEASSLEPHHFDVESHEHKSGSSPDTSDRERPLTDAAPMHLHEDKRSLVMLRDLFNVVGLPHLWIITDELLRTIELMCPFLLQKLTDSLSGAEMNSEENSAFNNFSTQQTHFSRGGTVDNEAFSDTESGVGEHNSTDPRVMPPLSTFAPSDSRINLPLVVSQLLPLINTYLVVQQVSISADLNLPASEVPRVSTQVSTNRSETLHQQKFSEKLSQYLCGSEKKLTRRHAEFIAFCERHRKILNLLVQNSPGILNGAFQPLVALAALCLSFENKRQYFRHSLKQLRDATRYEPIRLNVRRSMVFMDSFHQLRLRNGEEMKGKLIVHFQGEEGIDAGGLVREWYGILAKEMFNPDYALFRREGTKSEFNHPNPLSHVNPDHLCFFKFVGRVIGKAIYDGHHLGSYFTRSFYKQMLGKTTVPSDAECIDPELYKSLQLLLAHNIADLGLDLRFSTDIDEFGRTQIVDLIPDGRSICVTEENKHEYVRLLCEHKISQSIRLQTKSFLEGFHELIPPKFLTIFDDKELELLISGISFVNIEDLRANTVYHNYEATSPQIYWFWDTLAEMDQNTLATFLQFVTGTSRVPLGGFRELMGVCGPQLFSIHRDYDDSRLPSAHTCFNQLDLPQYPTREILKEKLLKAISEGSEGFGFA